MPEVTIRQEIDARGSACPGPLMELIRGIKASTVGEAVAVLSSDPGSNKDIPEWVQKIGYELVESSDMGEYSRFVVRKTK
ncbi:MAG: sulfurtransferase TusA family protein [Truepera sp.]|nr:sulfurtransferase TusA family protein [Truepera sp.]HRN18419.1 sulfurtransferase TusA family protein [Trueperaceae bacterium]